MNDGCPLSTLSSSSSSHAVMFAYEQCLLVLGHHPDIWYEAAQYLEQSSKLLAEKGVRDRDRQTQTTVRHPVRIVPLTSLLCAQLTPCRT